MWSGVTFSTVAAAVRSECVVSSWKLDSSSTYRSGTGRSSRSSAGSPRLPPASARRPPATASSATSVVTVLLPLVPVTATTGAGASRANSSMSPTTGRPRSSASRTSGSCSDSPGEITTCATPSSNDDANAPVRSSAAGACCRSASLPGGVARVSATRTSRPLRCRYRDTDSPVRPSPSTSARVPASSGTGMAEVALIAASASPGRPAPGSR